MKKFFRLVTTVSALAGATLLAQNASPAAADPTASVSANAATSSNAARIAPGSVIPVQLIKTVDAKKAKTGDEVVAKVTMDMKGEGGDVLVPKDTRVIGHITEAQARNKEQKESQLAIAFNQAFLKDQPVALPMSIQAVIGQQQNNDENGAPGAAPSPASTGTSGTSPMAGRSPSSPMSGQTQSPPSGPPDASATGPGNAHPHINAQTQGVVGISNLSLSPNSNAEQGSTLTSDKNNVKLESGTMLLLRVNQ
jgi:hypothetical protein